MTMARLKERLNVAIDPVLDRWLSTWLESLEFPPSRTKVIEAALRRFLEAEAPAFDPAKTKRGSRTTS